MDTKEKIIGYEHLADILKTGEWLAVAGYFDPLTAAQAIRLRDLKNGRRLLAVVLDREDAFIPLNGRAALIAALRPVDLVVIAPTDWEADLAANPRVQVVADVNNDAKRSRGFAEFVLERHKAR